MSILSIDSPQKAAGALIPICACCKKIRDEMGSWQPMEFCLEQHSGLKFTHGICQVCLEKEYSVYRE